MLRNKLKLSHENDNTTSSNNNTNAQTEQQMYTKTSETSKYFSKKIDIDVSADFLQLEIELNNKLQEFIFPHPVKYIYNPIEYAYDAHMVFVKKFCKNEKKILFLGMNPGPYGMCQTGVPFGEVNTVKEWFHIDCEINKPIVQCPKRPIDGFNCKRSEISGKRFWTLFKKICDVPENFFRFAYMHNYCPLALMKDDGQNVTPAEIKGTTQKELEKICDETLFKIIQLLKVEIILGIGRYAEKKALNILKYQNPLNTKVIFMPHPSPRSINNENWIGNTEKLLGDINVLQYFKTKNWLVN